MKKTEGGVTAAKGFMAAGAEAGIKYKNRKDMAMIYSKTPCKTAGVFTTNVVKAAPVLWDKEIVEKVQDTHAVVVNSGIANACTGKLGYEYCRETAQEAADVFGDRARKCADLLHRGDRDAASRGKADGRRADAGKGAGSV